MNNRLEKYLEGDGRDLIEVPSQHRPRGYEETRKSSARIPVVSTEIRTVYLPNTSQENYSHINLLDCLEMYIKIHIPTG
jgi:hypothetical protein